MTGKELDEGALASAAKIDPPPPAPDLLKKVGEMRPVRTRSRLGAFALVLGAGLVWPVVTLLRSPLRPDLGALPPAWIVAAAGLWGAALFASLAAALVPRRGDVLPSAPQASRIGLASVLGLLLFSALATTSVPGVSLGLEEAHVSLLRSCVACGGYVFVVAIMFLALGFVALRKVLPIGGRRIGMALGAAGGAAGGLALVFHCPIAVTSHIVLGHVGGVILAAVVGALLLPAALER
jgi:hypothetical protein